MVQLARGDYFPTSIWHAELAEAEEWKPELLKTIGELRRKDPAGTSISNKIGWQSEKNLHNSRDFAVFSNRMAAAMHSIARFLKLQDSFRPVITQCWANINPRGGYNVAHCHANSFLSGVYYLSVPENSGNIVFYDPRVQLDAMRGPIKEVSAHTAPEVIYKPKEGLLLLFPSWLLHRVEPNDSDRERVSIAFNSWTA
jgi:uncharacterized protein (TIGR02466 family)